jgi:hypothetical protein
MNLRGQLHVLPALTPGKESLSVSTGDRRHSASINSAMCNEAWKQNSTAFGTEADRTAGPGVRAISGFDLPQFAC